MMAAACPASRRSLLEGARLDLADDIEEGRRPDDIGGTDGVSVAGGAGKGREIAIGKNRLGQNAPSRLAQDEPLG
jgi:hypothetical protein